MPDLVESNETRREIDRIFEGEDRGWYPAGGGFEAYFWMEPDGNITHVPDWGEHDKWAYNYLKSLGEVSKRYVPDDSLYSEELYHRGWQRGVCNGDVVLVNGTKTLNGRQRASLERLGIRKELTIRHAIAGIHAGAYGEEVVYAPPTK